MAVTAQDSAYRGVLCDGMRVSICFPFIMIHIVVKSCLCSKNDEPRCDADALRDYIEINIGIFIMMLDEPCRVADESVCVCAYYVCVNRVMSWCKRCCPRRLVIRAKG